MDLIDHPELVATFLEEARERLATLGAGLLGIEATESTPAAGPSRAALTALFRDAHTLKGSARMMGLSGLVEVAHVCEDIFGALRDRRLKPHKPLVDLLLAAVDGMTRSLPDASDPLGDVERAGLVTALQEASTGRPASVPQPRSQKDAPPASGPPPACEAFGATDARPAPAPAAPAPSAGPARETVRVAVPRIHDLLETVGEAEVDARRVERAVGDLAAALTAVVRGRPLPGAGLDTLLPAAAALRELVEDHAARVAQLRSEAMGLAMVPLSRLVAGFPRLVRDLAGRTGKQVTLELHGDSVELDKRVLDAVSEALGHLVTNAVDHGCQVPAARIAAGKPETATVRVRARASGASVVIEVGDDGAGIDVEAVLAASRKAGLVTTDGFDPLDAIFTPALSTRTTVTESSGRGIGLDAVRATVEGLGGRIDVASVAGEGTTFTLTLPVSLGVIRCLLCRVGGERYAIPLPSVNETCSLRGGAAATVTSLAGADLLLRDGVAVPLLDLAHTLGSFAGTRARRASRKPSAALLTTAGRRPLAWAVDGLEGEADLVVTDLGPFLSTTTLGGDRGRGPQGAGRGIAGATGVAGATGIAAAVVGASILDDGTVVCLLDLRTLASTADSARRVSAAVPPSRPPSEPTRPLRVLVVEDSLGVRELERSLLASAGYAVDTAVDGLDGASRLTGPPYDLIVTDVEMPGMDGLAFTRTVRATPGWQAVPVIVMTSRDSEADRRAGMEAGADAYLHKADFSATDLLETVTRLLGGNP
jgi:chemotaxis protein histidine kinase CheA